jgi:glutaminyl-tRNA synthetase
MSDANTTPAPAPSDFIRDIVSEDLRAGKHQRIVTRFPPEPNGYLHIGHAKSICLNFGIARENGGQCNLRMDDTNPTREDTEFVDSIRHDVDWLIGGWADDRLGLKEPGNVSGKGFLAAGAAGRTGEPFYASDYFEQLYEFAVALIRRGRAYVCDLTAEQMIEYRGSPERPGRPSPWRDRSVEENLALFAGMRAGQFADGTRTLRAKIDMASPNIHLRDPALYRIRHAVHHRTGGAWCLYPMYDYAHPLSDYLEGITHSICTLEFEIHRPFYDWVLQALDLPAPVPRQIEFARLNLGFTVMSKRKLLQLVEENLVTGWDDPRLPTISGLRRRGVRPEALRAFAQTIGVTKYNGMTEVGVLEDCVRGDLNRAALRRLAVLRPIKVVLTNLSPTDAIECEAVNNPEDPAAGTRTIRLTREVLIESDDFMETPPPKYFRLRPGGEVRLKYACIIRCDEVIKDADGRVTELRCVAELDTRTGHANAGKKVKGTIHWVSAAEAIPTTVHLYDRLFTEAEPEAGGRDFKSVLNPASCETVTALLERSLAEAKPGDAYQFERLGYFCLDVPYTPPGSEPAPVARAFNRTITLKDTWAREKART